LARLQGGKRRSFNGDEAIGGNAESAVMMESSPTSTFEMIETQLILEL
jgi:hypothetical protein